VGVRGMVEGVGVGVRADGVLGHTSAVSYSVHSSAVLNSPSDEEDPQLQVRAVSYSVHLHVESDPYSVDCPWEAVV